MVHEELQTEMINIYRSVCNNKTRQKIQDNIWLSRLNGACEQFLQRFSLPVSPCSCSCNSVCQADGWRGEGAVTERPVKCKQSQGHVTGSKVTGSTWIMFHLLWFHCKNSYLLTFLDHLWMLSTKTCHREGDPESFSECSDLTSWPVGDRLNWDRRAGTPRGVFGIWAVLSLLPLSRYFKRNQVGCDWWFINSKIIKLH